MQPSPYKILSVNTDRTVYTFESNGKKGKIEKLVAFYLLDDDVFDDEEVYGLGLADKVGDGYSYENITDNGDLETIFTTVATIVIEFLKEFPFLTVYLTGNKPVKTRLYRIHISKNLALIQKDYQVIGLLEGGKREPFKPNTEYEGFYVSKK